MRQANIVDHIFLDHLDFVHIVIYLASGMNNILSLSVDFAGHSETSFTFQLLNIFNVIFINPVEFYDCLHICG